jgi:hypothetical protein
MPPVELGARNAMLARALAGVADRMVGAPGTAAGVTTTPADARLDPTELTALTLQT